MATLRDNRRWGEFGARLHFFKLSRLNIVEELAGGGMSVVLIEPNPANSTSLARTTARAKLVRRFFGAGVCAAIFWITASYATREDQIPVHISDTVAHLIWDFERITFPFVLALPLMLVDLKGLLGLIFMLAVAAVMNGGWFALLAVIVWYIREAFLKLR